MRFSLLDIRYQFQFPGIAIKRNPRIQISFSTVILFRLSQAVYFSSSYPTVIELCLPELVRLRNLITALQFLMVKNQFCAIGTRPSNFCVKTLRLKTSEPAVLALWTEILKKRFTGG